MDIYGPYWEKHEDIRVALRWALVVKREESNSRDSASACHSRESRGGGYRCEREPGNEFSGRIRDVERGFLCLPAAALALAAR